MDSAVTRALGAGGAGVCVLQQQRNQSGRPRGADGAGSRERKGAAALAARGEDPGKRPQLMEVLAIIHGESVRSGVFGDVVRERGHGLEEWSLAWGTPL